ncbi:MAG: YciI family protein [Chloroflexota bacterium]
MQYILLIYGVEPTSQITAESLAAEMDEYNAYTEAIRKSGAFVGAEALHPVNTATTVRVQNGKTVTTDGPFAETKEQLGGYYVVNVNNLDEAIAWAAKCPGAKSGTMEVRPIVDFSQM